MSSRLSRAGRYRGPRPKHLKAYKRLRTLCEVDCTATISDIPRTGAYEVATGDYNTRNFKRKNHTSILAFEIVRLLRSCANEEITRSTRSRMDMDSRYRAGTDMGTTHCLPLKSPPLVHYLALEGLGCRASTSAATSRKRSGLGA